MRHPSIHQWQFATLLIGKLPYLRLGLGVDHADDFDLDVAVPPEPVLLDLYLGRV